MPQLRVPEGWPAPSPHRPPSRRARAGALVRAVLRPTSPLGREVVVGARLALGVGLLWGLAWGASRSLVLGASDDGEEILGPDVALALLGVAAGLVVAMALLIRPGRLVVARTLVVILGALLAGPVAVGVGMLLGEPAPQVWGVTLFAGVTCALTVSIGRLITLSLWPPPAVRPAHPASSGGSAGPVPGVALPSGDGPEPAGRP